MQLSSHGELIAVMAELWTLLNTLAIVEPGALRLPSSDTGIHPKSTFHADAALAAGFHPKAVAVMSALPYLHTDDWDPFELEGSTFPMSYLHSGEDDFADSRKMFSHDNIMPPSAFRLTWQDVNGWDYIYDVEKRLVYVWNNINDPFPDYFHLRPVSPREAFQPLIDSFRSLRRVAAPERTFVETDQDSGPRQRESGTPAQHEAKNNLWKAMCELADLYLECGWDANAVAQPDFRRVEFVEKRTKYISEIIEPLEEDEYEAGQHARKHHDHLLNSPNVVAKSESIAM